MNYGTELADKYLVVSLEQARTRTLFHLKMGFCFRKFDDFS